MTTDSNAILWTCSEASGSKRVVVRTGGDLGKRRVDIYTPSLVSLEVNFIELPADHPITGQFYGEHMSMAIRYPSQDGLHHVATVQYSKLDRPLSLLCTTEQ